MLVTGTWTPPSTVVGWQRIWVHLPDNGAITSQADYMINTGTQSLHRVVNQRWNKNTWFDLGSFQLSAGANVWLSNATHGDFATKFGAIDISYDAIAFTPSAKPALSMVAFGDSYQAGEGLEPYYANADAGNDGAYVNSCHRSSQAYPPLVFNDLKAAHPGNQEFHFIACSGAVTRNVLPGDTVRPPGDIVPAGGVESSNEVAQLDSGWLDVNTTHVTIGIGGNDARFADILKACVIGTLPLTTSCTDPGYVLSGDPEPLVTYQPKRIAALLTPFGQILDSIRLKAPNAQIAFVGYMHVIATAPSQQKASALTYFHQSDITFFAQSGDHLNSVIAAAVAAVRGVSFVNPEPVFAGPPEHEAFAAGDEWINAIESPTTTGSGSTFPGAGSGSFHPKAVGHVAIENLVKAALS